ncbi:MAG: hypothetical protein HFJ38_04355 [Bacilli bacterium]|nr:hypothetical protein [Bacilli bacterium]MCI8914945.1 hypothetical protein [Lawsonibacter sp.]
MKLTDFEKAFLRKYLEIYNAKWVRVYNNKHLLLDTRVDLYTIYKRKLKIQPKTGKETYTNMFKDLVEGNWYYIPDLLGK